MLITRNQIWGWFQIDHPHDLEIIEQIFKKMTDEDLARVYGLKVLRPGYFYR